MQVHYVYTNLLGCEAELIYDGIALIASNGSITARSKRFSYTDGYCLVKDIDLDDSRAGKLRTGIFIKRCKVLPFRASSQESHYLLGCSKAN